MPTLDWIGKKAVLNHHRTVPYRLLRRDPKLSAGEPDSGNLLVEGDNLEALKALLPYYAGQVKCIYIDPPYNTGNKEWTYNDAVDSPEFRSWLGKVVGAESEDLSRHDKWLCMMYPRLALLQQFLRRDGVVFVSIDGNEVHNLYALMDEVFGYSNRVGTIVWKNVTDNNPTNISTEHEYILCYARQKTVLPKEWKASELAVKTRLLEIGADFIRRFSVQEERQREYTKWFSKNKAYLWPFDRYKFIDDGGIYTGSQSVHNPGKEGYRYDVIHPDTKKPCAEPLMGYRFPLETIEELLAQKRILFGGDETKIVELKVYAKDYRTKLASVIELDGRLGTIELKEIFPESKRPFAFPKPTALLEELLSFVTRPGDLVMDSFAGSATTGHAVLRLNHGDKGARRFILVEMVANIARDVAAERIRRVAGGYKNARGEQISGIGGGMHYCVLGSSLFDMGGHISDDVRFEDLAQHVFFTETGQPAPSRARTAASPLIGTLNSIAYYLLFNGILGDKRLDGGNILTSRVLAALPPHDGPRVIFGEGSRLGAARLKSEGVTFKQIPYQIKT
jgi:DNA modification methylase